MEYNMSLQDSLRQVVAGEKYTFFNGSAGESLYLRIVREPSLDVVAAATGIPSASTSWADSVIAMTEVTTRAWNCTVPADMPSGRYSFLVYSGSGAGTDPLVAGEEVVVIKN